MLSFEVASRFPCFDDAKLRLFAYTSKSLPLKNASFRMIFDVCQKSCVRTQQFHNTIFAFSVAEECELSEQDNRWVEIREF